MLRFEQPWRTAGRKVGVPPPKLDEAWLAAVGWLVDQSWTPGPLFVGGRSAGARVACRTADRFEVAGIVCLAFPLHLPGQPAKSRAHELLAPGRRGWCCRAPTTASAVRRRFARRSATTRESRWSSCPVPIIPTGLPERQRSFTPADLRATLVSQVDAFGRRVAESAGISPG